MSCPEGAQVNNDSIYKEKDTCCKKSLEGSENRNLDIQSYKNPKTWKKSITNFFRNQVRSTKSNDGDRQSGSQENFEKEVISPEQKWKSLGKVFKRQSFVEHWQKTMNQQQEESTTQSKRHAVRKVLSSYFGKSQK